MSSFSQHPSSYRDPSGFIFYHDGQLYRQVNQCFRDDFDTFISGGLFDHLTGKKLLISHQAIPHNLTGTVEWYQTLKPESIAFISYPYEWCFDMLKDAALLTLELAREAMKKHMMLKDASSFNVQWHDGRMVFIDTLSFERYNEQRPWIAYRQFCEHFFAPLALMHYLQTPLQGMLMAYPDGIPLSVARKLLPFKSRFNLHTYLHLHLNASVANKKQEQQVNKPFSKQKMENLLRSLEEGIRSFSLDRTSGVWSDYYDEALQRNEYIEHKKKLVAEWTNKLQWSTAFDAGANEGEFTSLLKQKAKLIISADFDHYSINNLYKKIIKDGTSNVCPLLIDLSNPSPAIGVNNTERSSFLQRIRADLIMALALIHHLCIGKNIPFSHVAKMFRQAGRYLLIEFVPKTDEKVQLMLANKKDVYDHYNEQDFINEFETYFTILSKQAIAGSGRTLYLMEAHEI